jgi:meso-butanediol dehydrogenase/(S,S)-butanediol dehydrogenase/diacetyl reductase
MTRVARAGTAVRHAVREATRVLGPIALLVNNAGTPGPFGRDWEVDADTWWECVEVSVGGAFICNQVAVPDMSARGGRVVHVASTTGIAPRRC